MWSTTNLLHSTMNSRYLDKRRATVPVIILFWITAVIWVIMIMMMCANEIGDFTSWHQKWTFHPYKSIQIHTNPYKCTLWTARICCYYSLLDDPTAQPSLRAHYFIHGHVRSLFSFSGWRTVGVIGPPTAPRFRRCSGVRLNMSTCVVDAKSRPRTNALISHSQ